MSNWWTLWRKNYGYFHTISIKNLALQYLKKKLEEIGYKVYCVPEGATMTLTGGGDLIPKNATPYTNMLNHVSFACNYSANFQMNLMLL